MKPLYIFLTPALSLVFSGTLNAATITIKNRDDVHLLRNTLTSSQVKGRTFSIDCETNQNVCLLKGQASNPPAPTQPTLSVTTSGNGDAANFYGEDTARSEAKAQATDKAQQSMNSRCASLGFKSYQTVNSACTYDCEFHNHSHYYCKAKCSFYFRCTDKIE